MFEIDDLFELTQEGAFSSKEEFIEFAEKSDKETLFSVIQEGAFSSPQEMTMSLKKKEESDSFAQEQSVESPTSSVPTITLSEEELQEEQPAGDSINKERANYFRNKERLNLLREDYVIGSSEYEEEINKRVSSSIKEREGIGVDLDKSIKSAASGLAEIPNFMMEQLFTAFMDEDEVEKLNKLDYEDRRDLIADLTAKGVQNLPDAVKLSNPLITKFLENDGLRKSNEISDEIRGELDYLEKISKDYDTSIGEDIISLDVGQASERIVGGVVQSVAPMMQSMIPYVGLASVGLASASSKSRDLQESGENLGLATSANAILSGTVEAVTEKISAGLGKKFLKSFDLSPEKTVIVLKEVVGKFLKDFNLEGLSESAVEVSNMLLDSLVSEKEDAFLEGWSRIIDSYIIGGAMGGTLATGGAIPKQIKQITESNRTYKDLEASKYSTLPEMFTSESDIDVDKLSIAGKTYSRKFLERDLKKMVSKGEISDAEMKVRMNTFDEIKGYFHETDNLDLTNEQRAQAANLIKEKIELERQIEGKDKSLASKKIKRINEINENLSNISDIDTEVDEAVTTETAAEELESPETQDIIYAKRDIGDGETAILKIEDGQKTVVGESQVPEGTNIIEESEADAQLETTQEQEVSEESNQEEIIEQAEEVDATQEEETETDLEPNQEGGTVDVADKDRVYANIDDIIQKTNSRQSGVVEKSELQENKLNNSINYLQKTKWYQQASDIQRESSVRDVYEKLGEKQTKNISVNRILAKKRKKISVDEKAALKSQIRLEARAARDKKLNVDRTRKSLMSKISTVLKEGKINNKVFNSVQKRINSVNLDNPIMTERLIDYVDKVFSKAENVEKISQANKLRAKAKKGNKSIDVNINEAAKDFAKINPLMVSDIDAYIDVAKNVVDGLKRKKVVLSKVYEYIDPVLESQRQKSRQEIVKSFEEETGNEGMTYDEVIQIINTQEEGGSVDTEKLRIARDKLTSQYSSLQSTVKNMYKNKKDPFTGENVSFSKKQVELMSLFSDSDPSTLPNKTLSDVVFGMSNMITNQTYGGLESILSNIQGNQSMRTFKGKSRDLRFLWSKSFGRAKGGYLTSIPVLTEQMFASKQLAQNFLNKTFFNKVKQDANKEKARSYKKIKSYLQKFNNVDGFHDSKNIFERGTFAFMFRIDSRIDDDSSVREDFLRKKNLLKENYKSLLESKDSDDVKKGEGYKEAYDNILKDSNNVSEIKSKMSEYNLKAVESWIEDFKERYGDYRDVSESVYNKILNKENNYTPISYKEILGSNKEIKEAEANLTDYLYQKMSGNLMKSKKNASLPKKTVGSRVITTHYIDLDFDTNMANSFVRTNIDVGTASSIQKLKGAMDSESFVDAFNNDEDAELMRKIINTYVRDKRGSSYIDDREMKRLVSTIDSLAKIGASTTLAGVFQPIKQIIPAAANTFINAGRLDMKEYHSNYKAINKLLEETGQDIANRGIESISSLDIADSRISSDVGNMKKTVNYVTDKWIKTFIANPDAYVARVSWLSYYNQAYRKKYGVENSNIDWSNHQLDQEIADYANNMINRNQNTSDADLQGMFLKDRNSMSSLIRKTLMPFANFAINQKMRLHADAVILVNKNASTQEKKQAARSFAATMTEATVFHGIGGAITYYMYSAVAAMLGYDEKDEDKDKRLKNIIKGRASYFVPDMLSPLPLLDTPVLTLSNKLLRAVQSDEELSDYEKSLGFEEEEPFVLYDGSFPNQSILDDYGMYGIYLTKLTQTYDLASVAITGEYSKEYYGKKFTSEYDPSSQESLSYLTMISTLYNLGFLPSEAGQVVRYGEKILQKKSKESKKK